MSTLCSGELKSKCMWPWLAINSCLLSVPLEESPQFSSGPVFIHNNSDFETYCHFFHHSYKYWRVWAWWNSPTISNIKNRLLKTGTIYGTPTVCAGRPKPCYINWQTDWHCCTKDTWTETMSEKRKITERTHTITNKCKKRYGWRV